MIFWIRLRNKGSYRFQFFKIQIPKERSDFVKSKIYPEASGLKSKNKSA